MPSIIAGRNLYKALDIPMEVIVELRVTNSDIVRAWSWPPMLHDNYPWHSRMELAGRMGVRRDDRASSSMPCTGHKRQEERTLPV